MTARADAESRPESIQSSGCCRCCGACPGGPRSPGKLQAHLGIMVWSVQSCEIAADCSCTRVCLCKHAVHSHINYIKLIGCAGMYSELGMLKTRSSFVGSFMLVVLHRSERTGSIHFYKYPISINCNQIVVVCEWRNK